MRVAPVAVATGCSVIVLAGCGGKNERPKAAGGATTPASSVPQSGGVGRYAYSGSLVNQFRQSCRKQKGGTDSNCTCVLDHLKLNTPGRELRQLVPLEHRKQADRRTQRKLSAAARSCGMSL